MIELNSEKSGILNSGDNDGVKLIIRNYLSFVSILTERHYERLFKSSKKSHSKIPTGLLKVFY